MKDFIMNLMKIILFGNTRELIVLQEQYSNSEIESIEISDYGCYINFNVDSAVQKFPYQNAYISDVVATFPKTNIEVGTVLFIKNGLISMLEIYTFGDDKFPIDYSLYDIFYENQKRDIDNYLKTH